MKVIPLDEEYVEDVVNLESKLIKPISVESVLSALKSNHLKYFVLLDNEKFCGFLECSVIAPESELFEIAILEEFQGMGYSKILMDYYIDYVKNLACETIYLEVNKMNKKAISLYEKYQFEAYGQRKNYYGENQDAILMKLKI